ncbi:hypothetical protein BJF78_19445 [Pseudonocardia sp. CNS-139]|nr:hypothetical protein BJF78_19445 [Pseudonocardia sp. CNS-139]
MTTHSPWDRPLTRRSALTLFSAAGAALTLSACAGGPRSTGAGAGPAASTAGGGEVVYAGYGGSYNDAVAQAYFEPVSAQLGVDVRVVDGAFDIPRIISAVRSGTAEFDIVDVSDHDYGQLVNAGVLEELDPGVVDAGGIADSAFVPRDLLVTAHGLSSYLFSKNVMWNTEVADSMNSWADVWDVQRYPGKRGFHNYPQMLLETALLADGVPVAQIYPLDVDRAFAALDRIKPHAVFLGTSQLENLVAQGEIVAGNLTLGRVKALMESGLPVRYSWNQAVTESNRLVVLKGARNRDAAMAVVAATLQPDRQVALTELTGYSPTLTAAWDQLDAAALADLSGSPRTAGEALFLDYQWWADNGEATTARFQDWLAG